MTYDGVIIKPSLNVILQHSEIIYDGVLEKPELDDILEHHGVKGMKWGFRKRRVLKGRANRQINTGNIARAKTNKRRNILKAVGGAALLSAGGGALNAATNAIIAKQTRRDEVLRNFRNGSAATAGLLGAGAAATTASLAVMGAKNKRLKKKQLNKH